MSHRKLQTAWIFKSIFIFLQPFTFIPKQPVANKNCTEIIQRYEIAQLSKLCFSLSTFFFSVSFSEAHMKSKNVFCVKFSCNWCFQRSLIRISCCCILLLIYYSQSTGREAFLWRCASHSTPNEVSVWNCIQTYKSNTSCKGFFFITSLVLIFCLFHLKWTSCTATIKHIKIPIDAKCSTWSVLMHNCSKSLFG